MAISVSVTVTYLLLLVLPGIFCAKMNGSKPNVKGISKTDETRALDPDFEVYGEYHFCAENYVAVCTRYTKEVAFDVRRANAVIKVIYTGVKSSDCNADSATGHNPIAWLPANDCWSLENLNAEDSGAKVEVKNMDGEWEYCSPDGSCSKDNASKLSSLEWRSLDW